MNGVRGALRRSAAIRFARRPTRKRYTSFCTRCAISRLMDKSGFTTAARCFLRSTKERYMPVSAEDVQVRLKNLGYYGGKIDGDIGPATRQAIMDALDAKPIVIPPVIVPLRIETLVPQDWLQPATFERGILHWTVGGNDPSE